MSKIVAGIRGRVGSSACGQKMMAATAIAATRPANAIGRTYRRARGLRPTGTRGDRFSVKVLGRLTVSGPLLAHDALSLATNRLRSEVATNGRRASATSVGVP